MYSHRPVLTLALLKAEPNVHVSPPSVMRDVWALVQGATLLFLLYLISIMVLA